jgi:oxygen-independent coproporphyrinogen-3 oxidase
MQEVVALLGSERIAGGITEFTAEANPEDVTPELATGWRRAGVTRVSLGLQSLHGPTLAWLERRHRGREGEAAIQILRDVGFESLSVDLVYGVPSRLRRPWDRDLEGVVALGVPHVTLWELTVEPGTALGRRRARGEEALPGSGDVRQAYLRAVEVLEAAGYTAYEASSLARPGHASRHGLATLDGRPYLGLGSGAHSFEPPVRRWNLRDWGAYQTAVMRGILPRDEEETLNAGATRLERIWLRLRSRNGLSLEGFPRPAMQQIRSWEAQGAARVVGGAVRMTPEGWHDLDRRVLELDAALGEGTAIPARADERGERHGPSR